jgi:DNA-binding MarR family transcriptional regulator
MRDMSSTRPTLPPKFHDGLAERLADAGLSLAASDALLNLDSAMFLWHRMAINGEVHGRLIAELGLDLELSQFHALTAITRIQNGIGRAMPQAATIGLLAEEMSIDPSRASRIASDLIASGYLRRVAVQDDGRKSVLEWTEKAIAAFGKLRDRKWAKLLEVFQGWNETEIEQFSVLFRRYCDDFRTVYSADR